VKDDPNDPLTRLPNDPVPCLVNSPRGIRGVSPEEEKEGYRLRWDGFAEKAGAQFTKYLTIYP